MQTKDFKGQDLRGRSFKNQDLTGADFSDCDLRGVDFSFANLTDVKFCNARMGRTLKSSIVLLLLQLLFSVIATLTALFVNLPVAFASFAINQNFLSISFNLILVSAILKLLTQKSFNYMVLFILLSAGIAIIFGIIFSSELLDGNTKHFIRQHFILFSIFITIIVAFLIAIIISAIVAIIMAVISAIATTEAWVAFLSLIPVMFLIYNENLKYLLVVVITYVFLSIYLGWRAKKKEENQLLLLRNWSVKISCWHGTEFAFANLNQVDFSDTDLKNTRFKNAKIINCNFKQAKNHHLALTENTPLEPRKVRDLVIDGIITDKNFATLDLRGLDFSNLNLEDFDFSHANLSGANLSHTQLTGATLEGWNIDTETRLDDIDCRYYYYLENGAKKRMPPEGEEYSAGEFTRIFQKIANTIDFIAHNEMELAAIKLSVEQVRVESGNNDIRVQAIEEKDGFIVVKVTVPKTEDRGVLYHEVNVLKQDYEAKIQALMTDNYAKVSNIELLKEQLKEQRQEFLAAIKPNISIENSTFNNNGITNLGGEINGNVSSQ